MNFLGLCFKLKTEVVVVGIGGWRKKNKEALGLVSLGIGGWRNIYIYIYKRKVKVAPGAAAGDGGDRCRF